MKKILALAMALCMIFALCAVSASADDPVTLVYAEVNPLEGTTVGEVATTFKNKVEELTNGSVVIDIQANAVLGSENDVLDSITAGSTLIDISRISAFALSSYGCEKATLLSLPFTFVSRDHFWNFAASDLAQEFLMEPQTIGLPLRGIFYGEEGFRHFFTNYEINGIEDLVGKKIRVSNDPVMVGMVDGLGASATVVPFAELYSALQTGVVDGAEQPISNYRSGAYPEVANNLILDGHTLGAIEIVITDNAWAKLNEEQQNAIMEAAKFTMARNKEIAQEKDDTALNLLLEEGCNVVEVEDKGPWQEACSKIVGEYTQGDLAALYQQILDLA